MPQMFLIEAPINHTGRTSENIKDRLRRALRNFYPEPGAHMTWNGNYVRVSHIPESVGWRTLKHGIESHPGFKVWLVEIDEDSGVLVPHNKRSGKRGSLDGLTLASQLGF